MPPEQCNPRGDVGPPGGRVGAGRDALPRGDGEAPFRRPRSRAEDAPLEDRFPQLEDEPRSWPVPVPGALSDAILACSQKDPARRPTAAELAVMMQPLVAELPAKLVLGRKGAKLA